MCVCINCFIVYLCHNLFFTVLLSRIFESRFFRYAFVQFTSYFAAKNALEAVNMTEVKGRPVAVDWVVPKDQYEHSMQREGAGEEEREEREEEGMADILSETSDAEIDQSDLESHDSDAEAQDSDDESHDSDDESHDIEATADDSDMESHDSEMISDDGDEIEDDDEEPHPLKREDTSDQKTIFIRYNVHIVCVLKLQFYLML